MPMNPRLLRPTASGFDPRRIAGLIGWWDFSDATLLRQTTAGATAVTTDGDVVGYAIDKSGNNRPMASNNDSRRPVYKTNILNGKSAVRFDGIDDAIGATTHSGTAPDTQTWFGVFANFGSNTSGAARFISRTTNAALFCNAAFTPQTAAYWSFASSATPNGNVPLSNAVYSLSYTSSAQCLVRQNGLTVLDVTTPNASYTTTTAFNAGAGTINGVNPASCDCLEMLIWHVLLSDSQRLSVDRYLARKYGLTLV
jgi:hypothetical protein